MGDETDPERAGAADEDATDPDEETAESDEGVTELDEDRAEPDEDGDGTGPDEDEDGTAPDGTSASPVETTAGTDTLDERPVDPGTRQRRLDEREMGLDKRAEDLDEREGHLDEREGELDEREEELEAWRQDLQEREASLNQRETKLDEREEGLDEFEADLSERAMEVNEHEETLHRYIDGQVEDLEERVQETMRSALESYEEDRTPGRFGPTGTLLAGIAGLALLAAGVGYGAWVALDAGGLLGTRTADLAVAAVLFLAGLVVNLGTVADRL